MTAQQKALEAPVLKEAIEGVLYVHNLIDPAHGVVWPYVNASVGDKVEFTVRTSTDNTWQGQHILTAGDAGKPIEFKILKHVFEKNLKPGASADLHYVVTRIGQVSEHSAELRVQLEL
ncbi:hypothetical protein [Pseudomonas brassicacearum]|jgi:hypothetical protein|uniref:Uncharacterized protein n=1 Tax=Pseudomonas brassicacearum TaxID=930166 RepID=A0A423JRU0_9PSED|nr:hypothetical protein [Pseudomonas brassicacearum]RON40421.1 hypothetical protein BK664_07635 [Pseudomonas brassicacearum]